MRKENGVFVVKVPLIAIHLPEPTLKGEGIITLLGAEVVNP
jgi:hypothetical protein